MFCLLYDPAFTTICDHWEDHSFDYIDLCQQSNVCFSTHCLGLSLLSCQEAIILWFHGCIHCLQRFLSPRRENLSLLPPFYLPCSNGARCHDLRFVLMFSLMQPLSLSSFTLIKRLFSSSLLSAIRMVSSAYLRLLMFLQPVLILACDSSSPTFLMMGSTFRLKKQGDSRQFSGTPFLILNQSVVPYRVLTVAFWPTYSFLRRQIRWSGIPISLKAFHSLSWSTQSKASIVNETEIDVFLKLSCFIYNPENIGNLITCSSSFSQPSLDIWKFLVCIMLKSSMQDFKHDLTSMGDECSCPMVNTLIGTTLDSFSSLGSLNSNLPPPILLSPTILSST